MLFYPDQRAISAATQISIGVGTEQRGVDFQGFLRFALTGYPDELRQPPTSPVVLSS